MKIVDFRCTLIGPYPVLRLVTDVGIDGFSQAESSKGDNPGAVNIVPQVMVYKPMVLGCDPTDVQRVVEQIRRMGGFKPWGAAVSMIEVACLDIAGKALGCPVYKLLGGKVRDRVRVYNGNLRPPIAACAPGDVGALAEAYAANTREMRESEEGFTIIKQGITFHSGMPAQLSDGTKEYYYGDSTEAMRYANRGVLTEAGFNATVDIVKAMKAELGDEVGLALDCGPGLMPSDLLRLAVELEPLHLLWMEDAITGDYTPFVSADVYKEVTRQTTTPIHTGEQIYLRENFKELIETKAVNVLGPDPLDVGGLFEMKWIAEYADLHGLQFAPHGTVDGLLGLAAEVQLAASLPQNYIAFEYCGCKQDLPGGVTNGAGVPNFWFDILDGLPETIVRGGFIDVADWERPGLGLTFNAKARAHLRAGEEAFFDPVLPAVSDGVRAKFAAGRLAPKL